MPTLEGDRLVFRFPTVEPEASFSIDFQRTLRIPDTDKTYPLPPGLGSFPLRHVEDHEETLPSTTTLRGGVVFPMWQAEAMWLNFSNRGPDWELDFPVAIKVAAGKINAVTGEKWRKGLNRDPQDYVASPEQPWLDGFAVEKGVIRQFVAMPLGDGYSVEDQLTGEAEWGGLQIVAMPLKPHVWKVKRAAWEEARKVRYSEMSSREDMVFMACSSMSEPMGMSAGGRMRQVIHPDPFNLEDWDTAAADRVFVTVLHAKDWKEVIGEAAPNQPPTARTYSQAGLPWFEHYDSDTSALPGSKIFAGVKSVANVFKQSTGATMPDSEDVDAGTPISVGPGANGARPVSSSSWD